MKYRIHLLLHHHLYFIFYRPYLCLIIIFAIAYYLGVKDWSIFLLSMITIRYLFRYHGILLSLRTNPHRTIVTMGGISPRKMRTLDSDEISSIFLNDFDNLLENKLIKTDIQITTHVLYSQGVLDLLFNKYASSEEKPKLSTFNKDTGCTCNGHMILIKKKMRKHINYMASIKIPLSADEIEIQQYFNRKYTFYEIIIPKELFS